MRVKQIECINCGKKSVFLGQLEHEVVGLYCPACGLTLSLDVTSDNQKFEEAKALEFYYKIQQALKNNEI